MLVKNFRKKNDNLKYIPYFSQYTDFDFYSELGLLGYTFFKFNNSNSAY